MNTTRLRIASDSPERTESIAAAVAATLSPGDVVLLEGDLGAGKTCFVRGLARGLELDAECVSSPSFVVAQRYSGPDRSLLHVDAYRIEGPEGLAGIDLEEMLDEPGTLAAIEWPSRLGSLAPERALRIRIDPTGSESRVVEIDDRRGREAATPSLVEAMVTLFEARVLDAGAATCPICGEHRRDDAALPFCSSRCRLADLSRWMAGRYMVSRPLDPEEEPLG